VSRIFITQIQLYGSRNFGLQTMCITVLIYKYKCQYRTSSSYSIWEHSQSSQYQHDTVWPTFPDIKAN